LWFFDDGIISVFDELAATVCRTSFSSSFIGEIKIDKVLSRRIPPYLLSSLLAAVRPGRSQRVQAFRAALIMPARLATVSQEKSVRCRCPGASV